MKSYYKKENMIYPVVSGKYGSYAKLGAYARASQNKMLADGFEIVNLSTEEISEIINANKAETEKMLKQEYEIKMQERFDCVAFCLTCAPLEIVVNKNYGVTATHVTHVANLANSEMGKAYKGCGKGTAYIQNDWLIAFHYGYDQPKNAPANCKAVRVEMSCYQICFI